MRGHVAVLGAGNWGTTLAHLAASNGHAVSLWTRDDEVCRAIATKHRHPAAVRELVLDERVTATTSLATCVAGASLVLVVVPAQAFREVARALGDHLEPSQIVVHATKGIELGTHAAAGAKRKGSLAHRVLSHEAQKVGIVRTQAYQHAGQRIAAADELALEETLGRIAAADGHRHRLDDRHGRREF